MRIGVDGATWTNRRGYGRFLRELVRALAAIDQPHEYVLFLDSAADQAEPWPDQFTPRFVDTRVAVHDAARADGRRSLPDLGRMSLAVAREKLDLFFFPTVYSYFPLVRPVKTLVGVHDTIAESYPELAFARRWNETLWRWKVRLALLQANACLTVSEHSKRSIARTYGYPERRIHVAPEAPAEIFSPAPVERQDFLLYVGGISPTKNLETLLHAYSGAKATGPLVLVGDYQQDRFQTCHEELVELAEALRLKKRVRFTGYVPDAELVELYRTCKAFVMPSWDEGFGLPAAEAMACGAPTIVSRGTALEEIAGEAALLIDPRSPGDLREKISAVASDAGLAERLSARAVERAASFSWRKTAERFLETVSVISG